ncbi:hypothetical protein A9Z42_0025550 [Trichoderma parareesei]|uniref:Uncharacterized protein n=1 Tax=Trichoderma parareesei TaxID=858221 RepID=A0A2H2Z368_TRIPA|nr:hypothetical protein A9Z42_0025550 [Trichoderma parareesei]
MVLPPSPQSPSPKYGSDYTFSRPSLAKEEIFSRKSLPTAGTDSTSSASDSANSQNSPDVEQLSRSDVLGELAHFTISWFSKWHANQPGKTELNPGTHSTQTYSGGSQSEPSQRRKRKARGQRDKDRGDWKARRVNRTNGDEPNDNDGNGDAPIVECTQPELDTRKRLACPFHKRYPLSYGHGKFELCATGSWKTYHRVRSA